MPAVILPSTIINIPGLARPQAIVGTTRLRVSDAPRDLAAGVVAIRPNDRVVIDIVPAVLSHDRCTRPVATAQLTSFLVDKGSAAGAVVPGAARVVDAADGRASAFLGELRARRRARARGVIARLTGNVGFIAIAVDEAERLRHVAPPVDDLLNTLIMDKRIIEDLIHNKPTNDVRTLRAIRKARQTDENGLSDAQWQLYCRFIDEKLSRKDVFNLSRKERSTSQK